MQPAFSPETILDKKCRISAGVFLVFLFLFLFSFMAPVF